MIRSRAMCLAFLFCEVAAYVNRRQFTHETVSRVNVRPRENPGFSHAG